MQLDMFYDSREDYLYSEMKKIENSYDRRFRAIFSLLKEVQDQLIKIKEKEEKNYC